MANTSGEENCAFGYNSSRQSTTASKNTAFGWRTLDACTTGGYNTAIGRQALYATTTGTNNVAVGNNALVAHTDGYENTAIGSRAGDTLTTGYRNCFMGEDAGDDIVTGTNNVIIGRQADGSHSGSASQTVVGASLTGKGDYTGYFAGSSGVYNSDNSSAWQTTSDRRIKKNIVNNNIGLDKINQIRVRNFEYRTPEEVDPSLPSHLAVDKQGTQVGVIAQEIQDILPDIVRVTSLGCYSVNPDNLTWYLVNAVQELSAKNDELAAEIASLKTQINN